MVRKILWTLWVVTAWCFQIIAIPRKENKITVAWSLTPAHMTTSEMKWECPRHPDCQGVLSAIHCPPWRCLEVGGRLIRPCLRKTGGWLGGPRQLRNHSLQDYLDYSSERTRFPNRVVQGTPPGLSFPHKRLDEKWTARCFSTVISCVELSPPGTAARENRPLSRAEADWSLAVPIANQYLLHRVRSSLLEGWGWAKR